MCAGYFCPTARSGLDCSERSERRPVTIPALASDVSRRCLEPMGAYRGPPFVPARSDPETCARTYACCVCVCPLCAALAPACGPRRVAPRPDFLIGRARSQTSHPYRIP